MTASEALDRLAKIAKIDPEYIFNSDMADLIEKAEEEFKRREKEVCGFALISIAYCGSKPDIYLIGGTPLKPSFSSRMDKAKFFFTEKEANAWAAKVPNKSGYERPYPMQVRYTLD